MAVCRLAQISGAAMLGAVNLRTVVTLWLVSLGQFTSAAQAADGKWQEVTSPHFTIITADSTSSAKDWLIGMEVLRAELHALAPLPDDLPAPLRIIVFAEQKEFEKAFQIRDEVTAYALVTVTKFANRNGRFTSAINDIAGDSVQRAIFLETILCLTDAYREPAPLWLVTGLQEIFGRCVVSTSRVEVGGAVDGSWQSLRKGLRVPMDAMLEMTTTSPTYQGYEAYFNAQSWSFTHYLLLADKGANRPKLARFVAAINQGESRTKAMQEAIGGDLAALSADFEKFAKRASYRSVALPVDVAALRQAMQVRPAREADLQLAIGRIRLFSLGADAAEPNLRAAQNLAPDNPEVYECLAELAGVRGDEDELIRQYREAAAKGSRSYQAHYFPALGRAKPLMGAVASVDRPDPVLARELIEAMKRAVGLRPSLVTGYEVIGGLMGAVAEVMPGDREVLQAGARSFPNRAVIRVGMAACDLNAGRWDEAAQKLEALEGESLDEVSRMYAAKLTRLIRGREALAKAEALLTANKVDEAEALLPQLFQFQFNNQERRRLDLIANHIAVAGLHGRIRKVMERKDWSMVDILVEQLGRESVPAALEAAHKRLLDDVAGQRPKSGP